MLENLKLSSILNFGFGLLLSVIVTMSVVSYNGLESASNGFSNYRNLARDTVLAGRLQANMLLVRLYVKEFFKSGRQQSVLNYQDRLEQLQDLLKQSQVEIEQADRAQSIRLIDSSLAQYVRNFSVIIDFKHQRDDLVFNQLDPSGLSMRTKLTEIIIDAYNDKDSETAYFAGRIQEHVLLARLYANKFLNTNDLAAASRFQQEIGLKIDAQIESLRTRLQDPKLKRLFNDFLLERKNYEETFLEIQHLILKRNKIIETQLDRIGPLISDAAEQVKLSVKSDQDLLGPELAEDNEQAIVFILLISAVAIILATFLSWFIAGRIRRPIGGEPKYIMEITQKLALGKTDIQFEKRQKENATGIFASVLSIVDELKRKAYMAEQISKGNLDVELNISSNQDTLGHALQDMVRQIKLRSEELEQENASKAALLNKMEEQDWLKSNLANIVKQIQGINQLTELAQYLISELAGIITAGHGAFYLKKNNKLNLIASYAHTRRKNLDNQLEFGEGLVGQCALEKQSILLTQVPPDYIQISSGLGEASPLNIIVLPVIFDNSCNAVIELASFQAFTAQQLDLLKQVTQSLGVIVNSAKSREKIEMLLTQSKQKTLELKQQSEQLQTQQKELQNANENLQEQTLLLTASEQELKAQSEELQLSNTELAQKQISLSKQKNEIEQAQAALTIKADELALASKYKSEFLANMSHELRTPLNSLLLLAKGLINNKKQNLDQTEVEDAKVIYDGGLCLLELINDIMDLSKVEAGKLIIHSETVKFKTLSRNLYQIFDPVANDRGLEFTIDLDRLLPEAIISDGLRIEQILRNLLSNAMKFTHHGGVTLSIKKAPDDFQFSHAPDTSDPIIALSVIDSGIGIPEEKQHAIFEAFQQQDGSTSRKYGGTGLGLTIARELTALLSGEIQVESILGEGSTFTLYLPMAIDGYKTVPDTNTESKKIEAGDDNLQPSQEQVVSDDRKDLHVNDQALLVIDDDPKFGSALCNYAKQQGYKCVTAVTGRSGIHLAQTYQPKGIILDINLPDISGYHVLEQLKFSHKTRHIPVQIITGRDDIKTDVLSHGAIGFLTKPVQEDDLHSVLDEITDIAESTVKHILLIEDDKQNSSAITRLLENKGVKITAVSSGTEGLQSIQDNRYDCIILDLGLPDINGFDLLKTLHNNESVQVPPVIIYTGWEISDEDQSTLNQYASSVIIKGLGSAEKLSDDVSLFIQNIEQKFNGQQKSETLGPHNENQVLENRKILLVDDDMRNSYALSKQLINTGFDVEMASNGQEAVNLLTNDHSFELILMDTMMPVMDGNEATRQIRKMPAYRKTPIFALTAKTMPEDKEKCLQAGASEFLSKPVDLDDLLIMMRIWLYKHAVN
ncbi:response regulator [Psychromonas aquimarina]|uniref:response regulator n=1 Tax=Psychromonas aquimarina TaxID=444919 RepID=UPI00040CBBA4|nr:response regulator [Psychromonas aquimarina]